MRAVSRSDDRPAHCTVAVKSILPQRQRDRCERFLIAADAGIVLLCADSALIPAPQKIGFVLPAVLLLVNSVAVSAAGSRLSLHNFLRL